MPLDANVNRRFRGSNIELGGADNSVRVSVVRCGSDPKVLDTQELNMANGSGLGPRAPSQNSKSRDGTRQPTIEQENKLIIESIVQNYGTQNLLDKSHHRIVLDE